MSDPELPPYQDIEAKRAESQRSFTGNRLLEPAGRADLLRRARVTSQDLQSIQEKATFSPFLEIGAGSGVRSLQLCQDYRAQGIVTDISPNSLRAMPAAAQVLGAVDLPERICCDSHYLPFMDNTFAFVFAYRTLHHCANPVPVVRECQRVLGRGGHFFFNEEPLTSPLRRLLRGKRELCSPSTPAQSFARKLGLEKVFWDDGKLERSLGIQEERFERRLWLKALEPFEKADLTVNSKLRLQTDLRRPWLRAFLAGWVGGNVRGLCEKQSGEAPAAQWIDRMICLDCRNPGLITEIGEGLQCAHCGRRYPLVDGIIRMLPREIEASLYGESLPRGKKRDRSG